MALKELKVKCENAGGCTVAIDRMCTVSVYSRSVVAVNLGTMSTAQG